MRNLYGRHRHLPESRAHVAFNTLNQSSAADLVKAQMIQLDRHLRDTPVDIIAQVHDEITLQAPIEFCKPEFFVEMLNVLEQVTIDLRVPIRWDLGWSTQNWAEASENQQKWPVVAS